jgi:hypothetical protein
MPTTSTTVIAATASAPNLMVATSYAYTSMGDPPYLMAATSYASTSMGDPPSIVGISSYSGYVSVILEDGA